MIKVVTFDLWNTILCDKHYSDYRINILRELLEDEDFPKEKDTVRAAYFSALDLSNKAWKEEQRHIPAARLIGFMLRSLNVNLPTESKQIVVQRFEEVALKDPPPLMEHAKMVLETLSKSYRLGLICNSGITPGRILRRVLKNHAVLQYFNDTVFSDEVGYHKPHPSIFRTALTKLQVKADEAIHIRDLLESDVAGAKAIGMKAVWFNIYQKKISKAELGFLPDYQIKTLTQLLTILDTSSKIQSANG